MSTEIKKLVIDRSRWLRGEGGHTSALLRSVDRKMCCLGFLGLACGVPPDHMEGWADPSTASHPAWPLWISDDGGVTQQDHVVNELVRLNDVEAIPDAEREACLARVFASHGVEVEFIDGDPVAPLVPEKPSPIDAHHIGKRFDSGAK